MRLAILITNTDHSDFAAARPDDAEKFARLVRRARPRWETVAFDLPRDGCPEDIGDCDGAIITGSPSNLDDEGLDWVPPLLDLIRELSAKGVPLLGCCFGHQAIATALGGTVGENPDGYVKGLVKLERKADLPWFGEGVDPRKLYASHGQQVTTPPEGVTIWASSPGCPVAGFALGSKIFTTQHHPEIEPDFMADLIEELADALGPDVTEKARASMKDAPDNQDFAEAAARFFERAV